MAEIKYVDLAGLKVAVDLINGRISTGDTKSLKTVLFDETNRKINFYKKEAATSADVPDFSIVLPEEQDISGLLEKISGGTKDNIVIIGENGAVIDSGIAKDDIALKTEVTAVDTKVGDITTLKTTAKTDVVGAINEVLTAVSAGGEAGAITITTDTTTEGMLKSYTIKQGGVTISTIDIPKDLVVTSGSVVVDPEGEDPGTYIKLVIANQEVPLLINVGKLVDIYVAKQNATQIQLAIDSTTREISATIVAGSVGSTELADNAVTTVKIADANVTLAKLATDVIAAFDAAGSASTAETNAKKYTDDEIAKISGNMDTFTPITQAEIEALFNTTTE